MRYPADVRRRHRSEAADWWNARAVATAERTAKRAAALIWVQGGARSKEEVRVWGRGAGASGGTGNLTLTSTLTPNLNPNQV